MKSLTVYKSLSFSALVGIAATLPCPATARAATRQAPVLKTTPAVAAKHPVRTPRPGIPTAPGWYEELPPAIEQAKNSGKDILIDFGGSNWCLPCMLLKEKIFTKPEFFAKASPNFVLLDIDSLTADAMPKDKLARYVALQKKYSVGSFPSVFLCTPDGDAYAWATYIPSIKDPDAYWDYLEPLIKRGAMFREGLRKAAGLDGEAKASAMVEALSQIRSDFIWRYHADMVAQIRKLDPADHTGFLAYLDGRKAYDAFTLKLNDPEAGKRYEELFSSLKGLRGSAFTEAFKRAGGDRINPFGTDPKITVSDVDRLIAKNKLQGETLQQALLIKAVIHTENDQPSEALQCLKDVVAENSHRGPFDSGQYFQMDPASMQAIQGELNNCQGQTDKAAMYLALRQIFEDDLPDRFEVDCHATVNDDFRPALAVRVPINWLFQKSVDEGCASLDGQAKTDYQAKMKEAMQAKEDEMETRLRSVARG